MADTPDNEKSFERTLRALLRRQSPVKAAVDCPDPALVSAYYAGTLDEDEAGRLEAHFATCDDCQAELALLARLDDQPVTAAPPEPEPEPQTVEQAPPTPAKVVPLRRKTSWVAPAALAAAAVLAIMVTYRFAPLMEQASKRAIAPQLAPPPAVPPPAAVVASEPTAVPPPPPAAEALKATDDLAKAKSIEPEQKQDFARAEMAAEKPARKKEAMADEAPHGVGAPAPAMLARSAPAEQAANAGALGGGGAGGAAAAGPVVAISRATDAIRWRFTGTTIERSEDRGKTWQRQRARVADDLLAGSAPTNVVCWAVGRSGTVLRTTDGRHWEPVSAPTTADLVSVSAWNETNATVKSADGSRFSTSDGGTSWSKL